MSVTHEHTTEGQEWRRRDGGLFALLDGLSHELGTPLTVVQNNLALVRSTLRRAGDEGSRSLLAAVDAQSLDAAKSAERVGELVRALRAGLGRRPGERLSPQPLDRAVAEEMGALSEEMEHETTIVTHLSPTAPCPLDRRAVARILRHLVENAALAQGPSGEIVVRVAPTKEGALLIVEDDGPGIPPHLAEEVYKPFFTTRKGANGLGLAFARTLVEAHGGELWHEAREPRGTRFVASFPGVRARGEPPEDLVAAIVAPTAG